MFIRDTENDNWMLCKAPAKAPGGGGKGEEEGKEGEEGGEEAPAAEAKEGEEGGEEGGEGGAGGSPPPLPMKGWLNNLKKAIREQGKCGKGVEAEAEEEAPAPEMPKEV